MKNSIFTFGLLFLAFISFGQGNDQMTNTRSVDEFNKITVEDGINVILEFGNSESVRIESNSISADQVLTNVNFLNRLKIELEGDQQNADVDVYVTYKNLKKVKAFSGSSIESQERIKMNGEFEIDASDGGTVKIDLNADEIEIEADGNSVVQLNAEATEVEVDVTSSAQVILSGSGDYLEVDAESSGVFDGYDFRSKEAEIDAADGSDVKVLVMEELDAKASNGGSVTYKGNPGNTSTEPSAGGTIEPAR